MKNLPIGIQAFSKLIENDYLYIDKTKIIYDLIKKGGVYFLSRPRRFGKSLLISTLAEIFSGNRELFKDLAIDSQPYDWKKYPVIHISFSMISCTTPEDLFRGIKRQLKLHAEKYQMVLQDDLPPGEMFEVLITQLAEKEQVVVLIDEYDYPILKHIDNIKMADKMREILHDFYVVLKDLDKYLKFILLTGVSKFSKTSIFSGLNQLADLTMDHRAAALCGYTQEELENNFADRIEKLAEAEEMSQKEILDKLKYWYNGFQFGNTGPRVYNPFSILNSFARLHFSNYWFAAGTPTFFVRLVKHNPDIVKKCMMLEAQEMAETGFEKFSVDTYFHNIPNLLYQTGYLTVDKYFPRSDIYQLRYPNYEVRRSMTEQVFGLVTDIEDTKLYRFAERFRDALRTDDIGLFCKHMQDFFKLLPHTIVVDREKFYQGVFFTICKLIGAVIDAEQATEFGIIDAVLEGSATTYVIEFKRNKTPDVALQQIKDKEYFARFKIEGSKPVVLVGMNFEFDDENFVGVCVDYKSEDLT